jgi:hypothetical protein
MLLRGHALGSSLRTRKPSYAQAFVRASLRTRKPSYAKGRRLRIPSCEKCCVWVSQEEKEEEPVGA